MNIIHYKLYDIDEDMLSSHNTKRDESLSALEVLGINKKSSERMILFCGIYVTFLAICPCIRLLMKMLVL